MSHTLTISLAAVVLALGAAGCKKSRSGSPDQGKRTSREEQALERALSWLIQEAEKWRTNVVTCERRLAELQDTGAGDEAIRKANAELGRAKQTWEALEARLAEAREKWRTNQP
jgi:chromosome segregation ATPase